MPDSDEIRSMFGGIAGRYDTANRVLCGGVDLYWRWVVAQAVAACRPQVVVDLACGSGDLSFAIRRQLPYECSVKGLDFCEPMLEEARRKQEGDLYLQDVDFEMGDCLDLPLENSSVDVLTIAFGFRNFSDRRKGLEEMQRILKPGGRAYILEFTQPYHWLRPLYYVYLKYILPVFADWVTGKPEAYDYLAGSIESFPECEALSQEILSSGFSRVSARRLTFGVVAVHEAING